jgi:hypothetical protein
MNHETQNAKAIPKKTKTNYCIISSYACFLATTIFIYMGFDKMTRYYSSEYMPSLNENAYVGGDAYNYIINGTYSTSFFVLATGFLIAGILLLIFNHMRAVSNEASKINSTTNADGEI